MYRYQIVPHDGQGQQTGTDDLEAASRAARDKKIWEVWWQGGMFLSCNEFREIVCNANILRRIIDIWD